VKDDAFRLESQALLKTILTRERDFSFGSYHAMPGQPARGASERPNHLAGATRKASRARDVAVSGHFAFRYFSNGIADDFEHGALPGAIGRPIPGQCPAQALFERILRIVVQITASGGGIGLRIADIARAGRAVMHG
jgi:hypothetical protein